MKTTNTLRVVSVAAVMLAGSCASPSNSYKEETVFADGAANHPIAVAPSYQSLKVAFAGPGAEISPDDDLRLASFVSGYFEKGNGSLTITVPRGPNSTETINYFAARLERMGVPSSRLMVGTHDEAGGDARVELGFVAYVAHTDACGNWTEDADATTDNLPMPDFGCAVQHNVAAMVADPRDLVTPRDMSPADAARRATIIKQYETGQTTAAQKTQDQSGAVSSVGGTGP